MFSWCICVVKSPQHHFYKHGGAHTHVSSGNSIYIECNSPCFYFMYFMLTVYFQQREMCFPFSFCVKFEIIFHEINGYLWKIMSKRTDCSQKWWKFIWVEGKWLSFGKAWPCSLPGDSRWHKNIQETILISISQYYLSRGITANYLCFGRKYFIFFVRTFKKSILALQETLLVILSKVLHNYFQIYF
jgi:hypothetical protein